MLFPLPSTTGRQPAGAGRRRWTSNSTTTRSSCRTPCAASSTRSVHRRSCAASSTTTPTPAAGGTRWSRCTGPRLAIAEEHGGLGMTWVELSILLEELGRANDPSPFVATTTQFAPSSVRRRRRAADTVAGRGRRPGTSERSRSAAAAASKPCRRAQRRMAPRRLRAPRRRRRPRRRDRIVATVDGEPARVRRRSRDTPASPSSGQQPSTT